MEHYSRLAAERGWSKSVHPGGDDNQSGSGYRSDALGGAASHVCDSKLVSAQKIMRRWLIFSVLLNVAILGAATGLVIHKGGWPWLIGLTRATQSLGFSQVGIYQGRVDTFMKTPVQSGAWVFLGDSLTDYAPTQELFGVRALNRGIAGDSVSDMAKRASEVSRHAPSVIVLWGGTNDLLAGVGCEEVVRRILNLAAVLNQSSPQSRLIVLGPPPIADRLADTQASLRSGIACLNGRLGERISEVGAQFANPATVLADQSGALRAAYSFDGIHLSGDGYRAWAAWLSPMLLD